MVIESDGDLFVSGNVVMHYWSFENNGRICLIKFQRENRFFSLNQWRTAFRSQYKAHENINPSKVGDQCSGIDLYLSLQGKTPFSNQLRLGNLARAYNFNPNFNAGQLVNIFSQSEKDSFIVFNLNSKFKKWSIADQLQETKSIPRFLHQISSPGTMLMAVSIRLLEIRAGS